MTAVLDDRADRADATGGLVGAARRPLRLVLIVLVVIGASATLAQRDAIADQEPLDLTINLVAGERMADRQPLYEDWPAAQERAVERGGPAMAGAFTEPTNSFVGPPSTALLHIPFTWFPHTTGVLLFRLLAAAGMIGTIVLVARSLPAGHRLDGFLLGLVAFLWASSTIETLRLGQGHEFVMLGLALALWGTARERWGWVGAGLALAALLKITPALLLVYLVARGHRKVVAPFVGTALGITAVAALAGRPTEVITWLRDVAPEVSKGVIATINQSLPAFLQRLSAPAGAFADGTQIGALRLMAVPLMLATAGALWWSRRGRPVDPLELGVLLLSALVAGPLTWMHYAVWAVLPIVLLVDPRRRSSSRRSAALVGGTTVAIVLLGLRVDLPEPHQVAADGALRVSTSPGLFAALVLVGVAVVALDRTPVAAPPEP